MISLDDCTDHDGLGLAGLVATKQVALGAGFAFLREVLEPRSNVAVGAKAAWARPAYRVMPSSASLASRRSASCSAGWPVVGRCISGLVGAS
jgi:hypothetical protein